jgi:hypothetical protein
VVLPLAFDAERLAELDRATAVEVGVEPPAGALDPAGVREEQLVVGRLWTTRTTLMLSSAGLPSVSLRQRDHLGSTTR